MTVPVHHENFREDSARWSGLKLRPDDIVVTAPIKSGTTWLQTICALLIFQTDELPGRLVELSPWVDSKLAPADEVNALLEAQRHRRFLKTHTPLDGLLDSTGVRYLAGARDPLDIAVSFYFQINNMDTANVARKLSISAPPPVLPPLHDWLLAWAGQDVSDVRGRGETLPGVVNHVTQSWQRRARPDVLLVHYADLTADLDGQMRRIAAHLGITVKESIWPALVEAASFSRMKERADLLAGGRYFKNPADFFRHGTSGDGAALLSESEHAAYMARVSELAAPDLLEWLIRSAP